MSRLLTFFGFVQTQYVLYLKNAARAFFFALFIGWIWLSLLPRSTHLQKRQFKVDWRGSKFLKDGEPFQVISGSFNYFQAHPDSWQRKLRTMRDLGLNTVSTYIEWSLHNPQEGVYNWDGIADLEKFFRYAMEQDLLVILRPEPYIKAGRDLDGHPFWLLSKYNGIKFRSIDLAYVYEVRIWYLALWERLLPHLYGNGGPIIMVQVENDYGSLGQIEEYLLWIRDETEIYVENKAVLFTNHNPKYIQGGHINGVLSTLNFDYSLPEAKHWDLLRKYQTSGPLFIMELPTVGRAVWGENYNPKLNGSVLADQLQRLLKAGVNVNLHMFCAGTHFDFSGGVDRSVPSRYSPVLTSPHLDAPMDETGNPKPKAVLLSQSIRPFADRSYNTKQWFAQKKHNYSIVHLYPYFSIISPAGRDALSSGSVEGIRPQTFEELGQRAGYVLYETMIRSTAKIPGTLAIDDLHDFAYIYVDDELVGFLSRQLRRKELRIYKRGKILQILVDSVGRGACHHIHGNDFKGILGAVRLEDETLSIWKMTKFPLDYHHINQTIRKFSVWRKEVKRTLTNGPNLYCGYLEIKQNDVIGDAYVDLHNWVKGVLFVNGMNLGRYWSSLGPQKTLFVPREVLKVGKNEIVIVESLRGRLNITFLHQHIMYMRKVHIKQ